MAETPSSEVHDIGSMFVKVVRSPKGTFVHMMLFTETTWNEETGVALPGQTLWMSPQVARKLSELIWKEFTHGEKEEA